MLRAFAIATAEGVMIGLPLGALVALGLGRRIRRNLRNGRVVMTRNRAYA